MMLNLESLNHGLSIILFCDDSNGEIPWSHRKIARNTRYKYWTNPIYNQL